MANNTIGALVAKNRKKDKWVLITINNTIKIKLWNLWAQRFIMDGLDYSNEMGFKRVGDFVAYVDDTLKGVELKDFEVRVL
jgi:hypothetical protein